MPLARSHVERFPDGKLHIEIGETVLFVRTRNLLRASRRMRAIRHLADELMRHHSLSGAAVRRMLVRDLGR